MRKQHEDKLRAAALVTEEVTNPIGRTFVAEYGSSINLLMGKIEAIGVEASLILKLFTTPAQALSYNGSQSKDIDCLIFDRGIWRIVFRDGESVDISKFHLL